jgi:hypothetical protein
MDAEHAVAFAAQWLDAWNEPDLEALMAHFADRVVFSSPIAAQILDDSDGVVRGKEALRSYWSEGIRRNPDLHFELDSLYVGIDTLVIRYRNQKSMLVCEVLTFDGPLVVEGHATYELPG